MRVSLVLFLVIAACRSGDAVPAAPVPPSPMASVSTVVDASSADCGALPKPLASYDAIAPGAEFSLAVVQGPDGSWQPASSLAMPLHHASSIEWQQTTELDKHRGQRVIVSAIGIGRTALRHDPRINTWFATYGARVTRVCRE